MIEFQACDQNLSDENIFILIYYLFWDSSVSM